MGGHCNDAGETWWWVGLGSSDGSDEKWLDSGSIWKGQPMGIAGGLDVGYEILQDFWVERMVLLVVWVSFSKDFWEALGNSLEGKLMPFGILGSSCEGLLYFKVDLLPPKCLCLERASEVSPLLPQRESWDRLGILAAGRTA